MKIAIFSDTHLGYGEGSPTEEDCYRQAEEAMRIAMDYDLILVPGDIFDSRVPNQKVLSRAMNIFYLPKRKDNGTDIVSFDRGKDSIHEFNTKGVPVISIFGTHERRGKGMINPVELLGSTGYMINLHGDRIVFSKDEEKIAIYGISGVPEAFAKDVFQKLDPKPLDGCTNILMMHQSVERYVYTDERAPGLKIEDMPEGFDLIIDGHIHWPASSMIGKDKETLFLLPGSTVTTQIRKKESEKKKGVTIYDTKTGQTGFIPLESQRDIMYEELDCEGLSPTEIKLKVSGLISKIRTDLDDRQPLLRIRLKGKADHKSIDFSDIIEKHKDTLIISIKSDLESSSGRFSEMDIEELVGESMSIEAKGMDILKKNADSLNLSFDHSRIFEHLSEDRIDDAESELMKIDDDKKDE